jgi:hypothetical protein
MTLTREHPAVAAATTAALDAVTAYSSDGDLAELAWRVEQVALGLELLADAEKLDIRGDLERRRQELRHAELDSLELALAAPDLPAERRAELEAWSGRLLLALARDAEACRVLT